MDGLMEGENVSKVIDMERSGATIAFDYFRQRIEDETFIKKMDAVRVLFDYIEDGDLWRWRLENSKAFSSGLKDLNIEFSLQLNPSLFDRVIVMTCFLLLV